eukprot:scpid28082/ scgid23489/ Insulin receptor; Insulin receptor subunit alpha; Insulin receptor subunit beta
MCATTKSVRTDRDPRDVVCACSGRYVERFRNKIRSNVCVTVLMLSLVFGHPTLAQVHLNATRCDLLRSNMMVKLRNTLFEPASLKPPACGRTVRIGLLMSYELTPPISDFVAYNTVLSQALADIECSGLLGNVTIELVNGTSNCDPSDAIQAFLDLVFNKDISMVIGPECSVAARVVAKIASYLSIPVFVFSTDAADLSDPEDYSTLFRLNPSGVINADGWKALLDALHVDKVTIVKEIGKEFDEFVRLFENEIRNSGVSSSTPDQQQGKQITLGDSITIDEVDVNIESVLNSIQTANARVVVAQVYAKVARALLCGAKRRGWTSCCSNPQSGENHKLVFVWPSWTTPLSWFGTVGDNLDGYNCSAEEIREAAMGSFTVRGNDVIQDKRFSFPGTDSYSPINAETTSGWQKRVINAIIDYQESYPEYSRTGDFTYAGFAYDAVWTAAYALHGYANNASVDLSSCSDILRMIDDLAYTPDKHFTHTAYRRSLTASAKNVEFSGASGNVSFRNSKDTNRIGASAVVRNIHSDHNACSLTGATTLVDLICNMRTVASNYTELGTPLTFELNTSTVVWGAPCVAEDDVCTAPISLLIPDPKCPGLETLGHAVGCSGAIAIVVLCPIFVLVALIFIAVLNRRNKKRYKQKYLQRSMSRLQQFGLKENDLYNMLVPDETWEIDPKTLEINRKLGEGAFGTVYGADYFKKGERNCTAVAVKTLREEADGQDKTKFFLEIQLMKNFTHQNVVAMLGVCTKEDPMYIVMELMLHGDLRDFLLSHRHLANTDDGHDSIDAKRLTSMALDVAYGLLYLHGINFIHRDLAARNCMVTTNFKVKIGDFGMARDVKVSDYYRVKASALLPIRWMARESILDGIFTTQTDCWSYGIVLFEMITFGGLPYPGLENGEVMSYIRSGYLMELPEECTEELSSLMLECWDFNPDRRPKASDLARLLSTQKRLVVPCLDVLAKRERNPPQLGRRATLRHAEEALEKIRYASVTTTSTGVDVEEEEARYVQQHDSMDANSGYMRPMDLQQGNGGVFHELPEGNDSCPSLPAPILEEQVLELEEQVPELEEQV